VNELPPLSEGDWMPAVKNGCTDLYPGHAFFDLQYTILGLT